jgi:hypothetical protein
MSEQVITINNDSLISDGKTNSIILNQDEKFLFEYFPLTPSMAE